MDRGVVRSGDCSDLGFFQASFALMSLYPNPPYDYSAEAHGLVFTAGACPLDENGKIVAPGEYEAQAERAVDNLLAALAERRVGADSLLKTTIYVVAQDRRDLVRVWDVVSARLGRAPSTLLGLSFLGYPDQLVEIEAVAALKTSGKSRDV
jgi:enamine deaminase RidA (YjgF/YER057c/UK114 family)